MWTYTHTFAKCLGWIKPRMKTISLLEEFKNLSGNVHKHWNCELCDRAAWMKTVIIIRIVYIFLDKLSLLIHIPMEILLMGPGWCRLVDWVLACEPKGHWFDSQSGHLCGLRARSPVEAGERQLHTDVFFFVFCFFNINKRSLISFFLVFFNFNFLLLFNYSCVPILPIHIDVILPLFLPPSPLSKNE